MAVGAFALLLALGGCATAPPAPAAGFHTAPDPSSGSSPNRERDPRLLMIDSAESMLGQPYRYGGAAPGGFDCSGLVFYAAASAGISVPRTAHEQQAFGVPVARADLKAGDLVFMHLQRKELHVGIVLDAERFIHAPSSGGRVRIDSLRASPYAQAFLGARRIMSGGGL
jgi:cell wall-associated NlpC family hydrolase